jgi:hypothetical protein
MMAVIGDDGVANRDAARCRPVDTRYQPQQGGLSRS